VYDDVTSEVLKLFARPWRRRGHHTGETAYHTV